MGWKMWGSLTWIYCPGVLHSMMKLEMVLPKKSMPWGVLGSCGSCKEHKTPKVGSREIVLWSLLVTSGCVKQHVLCACCVPRYHAKQWRYGLQDLVDSIKKIIIITSKQKSKTQKTKQPPPNPQTPWIRHIHTLHTVLHTHTHTYTTHGNVNFCNLPGV